MSCQVTQERFSDYYDGGLSSTERSRLEDHLKTCSTCRVEYEHYSTSLKVLNETRPLETTQVFMTNLKAAAQAHLERKELFLRTEPAPRPPAPSWVPYALAASAVVAFLAGYVIQSQALQREISGLRRDLDRARLEARNVPPPPAPVAVPTDEEILRKYKLVNLRGQWVPEAAQAAFDQRMVLVDGRLFEPKAAAELLAARHLPPKPPETIPAPPPEDPAKREEEVLRKYALVRHEGMVVPSEWVQKWGQDLIQVGINRWLSRAEFEEKLAQDHGLVRHGGRLMTREQAAELQSQQLIARPDAAAASNELTQALEGLKIGPRMTYRGLTVYLLLSNRAPAESFVVSLHSALATGKLELIEKGDVFAIQVRNQLDGEVLLMAGEVLAGGRCTRVVAEDTLVPRKKVVTVPVACVEPANWRPIGPFLKESGHYLAPPSVRRALAAELGQGAVWALVARRLDKGRTGQIDLFRKYADTVVDYRLQLADLLEQEPAAVGVAVALGDTVEQVEVFRNNGLLASYYDRIVAAAVLDLLERSNDPASRAPAPYPNTVKGVKHFLESAFSMQYDLREGGLAVRKDDVRVGRASVSGGGIQHAFFFASGAPEWDRRASLPVKGEKLAKVLAEYEDRMKATPDANRKVEVVRELASLKVPEALTVLVNHMSEPALAVRRAVIEQMGDLGDRRAYEPLSQLLPRSRKDAPVFSATAQALSRLGDERAVDLLFRQGDGGDPELGRVVVLALPELLLQVRTRDVLEKSVGRLVSIHESADTGAKGEALSDPMTKGLRPAEASIVSEAARTALRQVTGQDLASPLEYRKWWNDREKRDRFLKERTGK